MSEIVSELDYRLTDVDGREYFVNIAAEAAPDGRWEAWLEFVPLDDSEPLLTGTETHQATRADVLHWAGTLSGTFIEGAFQRATGAGTGLATRPVTTSMHPPLTLDTDAVVDPFTTFALGRDALRMQLLPLTRRELLSIIEIYNLNPAHLSLRRLSTAQLVTFIVTATETQWLQGRR